MTARYNYCRDFLKWVHRNRALAEQCAGWAGVSLDNTLSDLRGAEKFVLLDQSALEGTDYAPGSRDKGMGAGSIAQLPYDTTLLEFSRGGYGTFSASIVMLYDTGDGDCIFVLEIVKMDGKGWMILPCISVRKEEFLRGTYDGGHWCPVASIHVIGSRYHQGLTEAAREATRVTVSVTLPTVRGFMAALSCSNIETQTVPVPRHRRNKKTPFPYDEYHELVVRQPSGKASGHPVDSGDHRSPREHLRRGHIRRISDEHHVWVNSCVVGAGGEGGRISKAYRMTT